MGQQTNPIICDQVIENENGKMHIRIDLTTFQADVFDLREKLLMIRGIPADIENLPGTDAVVQFILPQLDWEPDDDKRRETAMQYARTFYRSQAEREVMQSAFMLAILRNTQNTFNFDPKPYPETITPRADEGVTFPTLPRNLAHPLERKLKQILDLISVDGDSFVAFRDAVNRAEIAFGQLAEQVSRDKDGFRTRRARRVVHPAAIGDGGESQT